MSTSEMPSRIVYVEDPDWLDMEAAVFAAEDGSEGQWLATDLHVDLADSA